jgi:3-phenylpropionate/trans-cinnamate dioxygenase ferredoxin subunit
MEQWTVAARAGELAPGEHKIVDVDGTRMVLFNLEGAYYAIEDVCTHDGGALDGGCVKGDQIICPRHGARFCIKTGAALTPPAYEPVSTFPVRLLNGEIQVRDDRWD